MSDPYRDQLIEWVRRYLGVGWPVIMLPYRSKSPHKVKGWQNARPTVEDFEALTDPTNAGGLLGLPANGLCRLDADTDAAAAAMEFYCKTPCIMGRDGVDRPTGYFYYVDGDLKGPLTVKDPLASGDEATVLDVLWTGKQTVLPPSEHPDGGQYKWVKFGAPQRLTAAEFEALYRTIAATALLAEHYGDGGRHDFVLALSGGLLGADWQVERVEDFVRGLCYVAGDAEVDDRIRAVYDTADRISQGRDAVGFTRLADYVDDRIVRRVRDLLGITEEKRTAKVAVAGDLRLTDEGNAERMAAKFGDRVLYCPQLKKWLTWSGTHWQEDGKYSALWYAVETARSIREEAEAETDKARRLQLAEWALDSESARRLNAIVQLAAAQPTLRVSVEEFDRDPWKLNCANGVLDLKTFQLADHDPKDYMTKRTLVAYNPKAECPRFLQFMDEVFGSVPTIGMLQEFAGLCLTGSTREEKFPLCWGEGSNGKSKFLGGISYPLGDYATTTNFDTFDADSNKHGSIGNDLAALRGCRLVVAIEADNERRLAEAKVKRVTGGDLISCRKLYGEYFTYRPTFKLWLAVNHKPIIRGNDYGIWRRVLLVPFTQTFKGEDVDKDIEEKLQAEAEGILAWMVEGLKRYLSKGLRVPEGIAAASAEYKEEMNLIAGFLAEVAEVGEVHRVSSREIYTAYVDWSKDFGERQMSNRAFSIQLRKNGFEPWASNGVRGWAGLRVRPQTFTTAVPVNGHANGAKNGTS